MASELKVDKFTGVTTAGSIVVTGEGNSTTTNLQQGLAKCWVTHPHDDVVDDSFNLSSLTDSATGRYICNFNNNMASSKYIVPATGAAFNNQTRGGDFVGMDMDAGSTDSRSTSACNTACSIGADSSNNAGLRDRDWTMHIFFGDLA